MKNIFLQDSDQTNKQKQFQLIDMIDFGDQNTKRIIKDSSSYVIRDIFTINKNDVQDCFKNQIQQPSQRKALIVMQILTDTELKETSLMENEKISFIVSQKQIFKDCLVEKTDQWMNKINIKEITKSTQQQIVSPFVTIVFPQYQNIFHILENLPFQITPYSQYDIFSYLKYRRVHDYRHLIVQQGFIQELITKGESEVFLNWGETQIEFKIYQKEFTMQKLKDQNAFSKVTIKPMEIIVIHGGTPFSWQFTPQKRNNYTCKLLNWQILPRDNLMRLMENKKNDLSFKKTSNFVFLIDFCFHEFAFIEELNQDSNFLYQITNYLSEIAKQEQNRQVLDKYGLKIIQEGCQILINTTTLKKEEKYKNSNLLRNALFQNYEKKCFGNFIGTFRSTGCRLGQKNRSRNKNKVIDQNIFENSISELKQQYKVQNVLDLIKGYTLQHFKDQTQQKMYHLILERLTSFSKDSKEEIIKLILPDYKPTNSLFKALELLQQKK